MPLQVSSRSQRLSSREAARGARPGRLEDGARVAVVGGGPAGSLFSFFLLGMAERQGMHLEVEVYEPRNFEATGPPGCNMCGGLLSETLVQSLALEGVTFPDTVVQRGIDAYVLHTAAGSVRLRTPVDERRIGAVHRGAGPRGVRDAQWESLDRHLLSHALARGARLVGARVISVSWAPDRAIVEAKDGSTRRYDLVVVAAGVNSRVLEQFERSAMGYRAPRVVKTLIREYALSEDAVTACLGSAMHVFLLDAAGVEFAAIIPKHNHATVCILGDAVDDAVADAFLSLPVVKGVMPAAWLPQRYVCECRPSINVRGARRPYGDRLVFIGDCAVTRLYKDGIGAAYRTAKAAARTAVFEGVSADAFRRHYAPVCCSIERDNRVGAVTFMLTRLARRFRLLRRGMLRMVAWEQRRPGASMRMTSVLWDMFSGSATYSSILARMLAPAFVGALATHAAGPTWTRRKGSMEVGHVESWKTRQDVR